MAATSVTGKGLGSSGKLTTKDLAILVNGPCVFAAGTVEVNFNAGMSPPSSPPDPENMTVVYLPVVLPNVNDYCVILTANNAITAYVVDLIDDDDSNMTGFTFSASDEGTVNYMVVRKGFRS